MSSDLELAAWLRLTLVPGLGPRAQRELLSAFGLPSNIFAAGHAALVRVVGEDLARRTLTHDSNREVEEALRWGEQPGNHFLTLADSNYPASLLEIADPPTLLYARGNPDLLKRPMLAVVGSRNATGQGLSNAERFSAALSEAGFTIVSGLALGIDAAAHRGALRGPSSTVAVLGTGVDRCYPSGNAALYERIAAEGLMLSECPLGTAPFAANFPRRNRLISGLAHGVLVVEAAISSGSLITARCAGEQGREVFAIPGSIHSPLSKGCHALIKQGAKLVESAQDILEELGHWVPRQLFDPVPEQEEADEDPILRHLGYDPCTLDMLCQRSGLTPDTVSAMLLQHELDGKVTSLPGGRYQRKT